MSRKLSLILMFSITIFSTISLEMLNVEAQQSLQLQVKVDKEIYDSGEIVRISGIVSLSNGTGVANALVSIQVMGPDDAVYHIALVYSNDTGGFLDEYRTPDEAPNGLYTAYIKASKVGFEDAQSQVEYSVIPELSSPSLAMLPVLLVTILAIYVIKKRE